MPTDLQNVSIARYMLQYAKLMQAEAEKMELLGVNTVPSLFDTAQEIFFLSELLKDKDKEILKLVSDAS